MTQTNVLPFPVPQEPESTVPSEAKRKPKNNILDLSSAEARAFLLKGESYCNFDLPSYFTFDTLLQSVHKAIAGKRLSDFWTQRPRDIENINHVILNNKDGKYAWRPFTLVHPALYVEMIQSLTEKKNWDLIKSRFKEFSTNNKIECVSLPVKGKATKRDKSAQILFWWEALEQRSIELSLDYEYLLQTDITDCYGSIYTHSIAWALHGKAEAKAEKGNKTFLGNVIDGFIQDISYAQTNGIPQGSVLMDFIAEMVLGYADLELAKKLDAQNVTAYHILRYRDDYKIFTNNPHEGDLILKALTEVLIDLGMRLNSSKTKATSNVIRGSIKEDKLYWIQQKQAEEGLQKHLLIIHSLSEKFPNCGSLAAALKVFYERIIKEKSPNKPIPIIGIASDIARHSPRTYSMVSAIISKLLEALSGDDQRHALIKRIQNRFKLVPNTGHLELWLQRICLPLSGEVSFDEPLCKITSGATIPLWNSNWLNQSLQNLINNAKIVDQNKIKRLPAVISQAEFDIFVEQAWRY